MAERITDLLADISRHSAPGAGVSRLPFTPEHRAALDTIRGWMETAGLTVSVDAAGTMIGRREGPAGAPVLLFGSHQDSVRNGGMFDGIMGVLLPVLALRELRDVALPFSVEVLAFADEEGVRFPTALIGPRALAGNFDPASLELRDANGISIRQAMADFGLDADAIPQLDRRNRAIIGYFETHIEQGPVLEAGDHPVGLVTSICGIERHLITLSGRPGHAGTVPMALRADALAGAAEMIVAVERFARDTDGVIATVGQIAVTPNAVNVVPGAVEFSLEVRSPTDELRREAAANIIRICADTAKERGLTLASDFTYEQVAQPCDGGLMGELEAATQAVHGKVPGIPSGATHDASAMSELCPMAMLFVRCRDGASHLPEEFASEADMEVARRTLSQLVRNLADKYR